MGGHRYRVDRRTRPEVDRALSFRGSFRKANLHDI